MTDEERDRTEKIPRSVLFEDGRRVAQLERSRDWLASPSEIIRNAERERVRMFGIDTDGIRQKERARVLEESGERMCAILDAARAAIMTMDRHGTIQDANRAAARLFGYPREELLGQNLSLLMTSTHRQRHLAHIERFETREPRVIGSAWEVLVLRKDGSRFHAELSVSAIDHLDIFVGVLRDVSERKAAEAHQAALAKALQNAEEKERRKFSQFLHDELQQLLVAAKIHLDSLEPSPSREDLAGVASLISEALDSTRALSLEMNPPFLEESGLGATLGWLGKRMASHHQMHVTLEIHGDAGSVRGQMGRLAFALVRELLFNAAKHSGVSEASLEARILSQGWLELVVSDRGSGFDVKERVASAPCEGLGLTSVHERVHLASGELLLESRPGRGTCATLRLPLSESAPRREGPVQARGSHPGQEHRSSRGSSRPELSQVTFGHIFDDPARRDEWRMR